jgi:hypothetical protein
MTWLIMVPNELGYTLALPMLISPSGAVFSRVIYRPAMESLLICSVELNKKTSK